MWPDLASAGRCRREVAKIRWCCNAPLLLHLHSLTSFHHLAVHHHHHAVLHHHLFPILHLHRAVGHHLGAVGHGHLAVHGLPLHRHHLAIFHHDTHRVGSHEPGGQERREQQHDSDKRDYTVLGHW